MRSKKSASKMAVAMGAAKSQANDLQEKVAPAVAEARERLAPAVADARERLTPVVTEARERFTPVVADARERLSPVVDDARVRLADLAETVATRLDDSLPDHATPAAVKKASRNSRSSGGKVKKVLVLAGVGTAAALVAKKLTGRSEPQWQSTAPGRPVPPPTDTAASSTPEPAASVSAMLAAEDTAVDPAREDVAGGGTPDEAAADATDVPHRPTTPDAPAEEIDIDKRP